MRISRRGLALILSSLALVDVALGQVQAPSETSQDPQPPQTAPPVEKTPTLPKMQVVAPPKKKDAPPPQTAPSAEKAPVLPKIEVVAPKQKAPRPPPAPPKALPAPAAVPLLAATPPPSPPAWAGTFEVRMSPVGGSELPVDKVPAGISIVTSPQIERLAFKFGRRHGQHLRSRRQHQRSARQSSCRRSAIPRLQCLSPQRHTAGACHLPEWRAHERGVRR